MEASKDIVSDAFEFIWTNYAKIDKATARSYLYIYMSVIKALISYAIKIHTNSMYKSTPN